MEKLSDINRAYLRDKGLSEKGVEQARSRLVEVYNVMNQRLEETGTAVDNIITFRNSGGIEIHKTREAIVLGPSTPKETDIPSST